MQSEYPGDEITEPNINVYCLACGERVWSEDDVEVMSTAESLFDRTWTINDAKLRSTNSQGS